MQHTVPPFGLVITQSYVDCIVFPFTGLHPETCLNKLLLIGAKLRMKQNDLDLTVLMLIGTMVFHRIRSGLSIQRKCERHHFMKNLVEVLTDTATMKEKMKKLDEQLKVKDEQLKKQVIRE